VRLKLGERDRLGARTLDRPAGLLEDQAHTSLLLNGLEQLQQRAHVLGVTQGFEHHAARQRADIAPPLRRHCTSIARINQLERGVRENGAEGGAAPVLDRFPQLAFIRRRGDLRHQRCRAAGLGERRQAECLRDQQQLVAPGAL